jgi:hypothetical protein
VEEDEGVRSRLPLVEALAFAVDGGKRVERKGARSDSGKGVGSS